MASLYSSFNTSSSQSLEPRSVLSWLFFCGFVCLLCLSLYCFYNAYLSPLSSFPGPKIAAIGPFYEFYHDVIRDGLYLWEIEKMHKKYGPIVRINAHALHIHDPEYFSTIYASGKRKITKDPSAVAGYTFPHSTISTIDHDLHRRRRAVLNPYFSKRAISALEALMHERLDKLCFRLSTYASKTSAKPVNITAAFSAFTADTVTSHFYGSHADCLSSQDFEFNLRRALSALSNLYNLSTFLPFPPEWLKRLPSVVLSAVDPAFPQVVSARKMNETFVKKVLEQGEKGAKSKAVIISALTDPEVPLSERSLDRLLDEGEVIILAGIDTTARTLAVALFHLLKNEDILHRIREELGPIKQSPETWTIAMLESLPLLRGVVQESLRHSNGLVVRIPRISAIEPWRYNGYTIPPGTPVSQSTYLVNNDPSIFPEPSRFKPDRWIEAAKSGINLEKHLVSFSKGSRQCIGINMAYGMLFLGIARVVMSLDMRLAGTDYCDLEVYHTRAFSFPRKGDGSVHVTVMDSRDGRPVVPPISRAARIEQV